MDEAGWMVAPVALKVVSGITFFVTGSWLMEANIPYRLIPRELPRVSIAEMPERCFFTHALLSVCFQRDDTIAWLQYQRSYGADPLQTLPEA